MKTSASNFLYPTVGLLAALLVCSFSNESGTVSIESATNALEHRTITIGSKMPALAIYDNTGKRVSLPTERKAVIVFQTCGCAAGDVDALFERAKRQGIPAVCIWLRRTVRLKPERDLILEANRLMTLEDGAAVIGNTIPTYIGLEVTDGRIAFIQRPQEPTQGVFD